MTYPLDMIHPHARKASVRVVHGKDPVTGRNFVDHQGSPDIFPPVTVNNDDQEERHRAMGYLAASESPKAMKEHEEYPRWLKHPAGDEEKPDVLVTSEDQEGPWLAKGYRAGNSDPLAFRDGQASPFISGKGSQQYPMLVDGAVVDPRLPQSGPQRYPMWVKWPGDAERDALVNSAAEEDAARAKLPGAKPAVIEAAEAVTDEKAGLLAMADDLGVQVDKRWGVAKLREALDAATAAA